MDKVKLGIVGYGNMGFSHTENFKKGLIPNMELVAICDIDPERRAVAKADFPSAEIFDDAEKMYASGLCDAVLVAVWHYGHPQLVIKALEYGLHAITEKPAGVYTKQVKEMNAAAEKSDKVFGIMYNQRTNPVYQKLREMIQDGQLGHIKRITWIITDWYRTQSYYDSGDWRATWSGEGGGVLLNQCPHQLDLWQWLCGMPCKVRGFLHEGKWHKIEVEDDVTSYWEFENGATGTFITTTGDTPGTNRFYVSDSIDGFVDVANIFLGGDINGDVSRIHIG